MNRQQTYLSSHSLSQLQTLPDFASPRNIFAVIDESAYRNSGAEAVLASFWKAHRVTTFTDFRPNPQLDDVQKGLTVYQQAQPDVVIALGGGTAIDMAKLISGLAGQESPLLVIYGEEDLRPRQTKLIVIPTTAGTGSEATQFAVVYVDGKKYSLDHPSLLPDIAIIDPQLMATLPPAVTAATGLDAFCQAIESIWAVGATDESMRLACEAASLAYQYLPAATMSPTSESRFAMCRASNLAGRAINITRTTACHALSYPMTSSYGIPHGIAVALTLSPMLQFNSEVNDIDCADPRGASDVRQRIGLILKALNASDVQDASNRILKLLKDVGCPASLSEAGITSREQIDRIIAAVNLQRMHNNPRQTTPESLVELLYV